MTSRRTFLTFLSTLPAGACFLPMQLGAASQSSSTASPLQKAVVSGGSADAMNEALEMLAPYGPSFQGGLSNHGPMMAEALVSLGREDAVVGWVESYRSRLAARAVPHDRIDTAKWQAALGDGKRAGDWNELFRSELAESPWREVVARWIPRLAPGIAAAGLHSVIRTGHAVCSLQLQENALRTDELARALSYWASEYLLLPGKPSGVGALAPSAALKQVTQLPRTLRVSRGLITTELKDLVGFEPFVGAIDLVDPTLGSPTFMADLLASFAGVFVNTRSRSFEFLHAITGAAAVNELLPFVKPEHRAHVLAYTWQVTAGLFTRFGQEQLVAECSLTPANMTPERVSQLTNGGGDEHTIKLTAACLRESRRNPDPRLLAAAAKRAGIPRK